MVEALCIVGGVSWCLNASEAKPMPEGDRHAPPPRHDPAEGKAPIDHLTERSQKIGDISRKFAKGEMSFEQAQKALEPYAKEDVALRLPGLNDEVVRARAQLKRLEAAQRDPKTLIDIRVKEMLGLVRPDDR